MAGWVPPPAVGSSACTAAPVSWPRRAAAPSSSAAAWVRPGSISTAMTRDERWPAFPLPGSGALATAVAGSASSAPRRRSSRTASWTCWSSGPSSTRFARAWSIGRVSPTTVGLPASPQGPSPRSAAPIRVRRSAGTAARPSGSTLQGSQSRSATDRTAGRAISTSWKPSSSSSSSPSVAPRSSRRRTPPAKGRSRSSATSGPTWPVSPSMELRPRSTRSKGPAARARAVRARAVASVSDPANASSQTWTPGRPPRRPPRGAHPRHSGARGSPRCTSPPWRGPGRRPGTPPVGSTRSSRGPRPGAPAAHPRGASTRRSGLA